MKLQWLLPIWGIAFSATLFSCGDDNNNDNSGDSLKPTEKFNISGKIEKGPFVQGSKVTLCELGDHLSQTGKTFSTQTISDLGTFNFDTSIQLNSQFVELEANGYFFNEVKGELSTSTITLRALSNVENRNAVNVNLMTHLECGRVRNLVREGMAFSNAKKQAERELLACFAITDEISMAEDISITDNSRSSAVLLAISSIMLCERNEAEFTGFISKFSTDFADNGKIDDASILENIRNGQAHVRPKEVIRRMKEFYDDKDVDFQCDDFSSYIDFNGDGVIDEKDEEEIVESPNNGQVEEGYFFSEENLKAMLTGIYQSVAVFTTNQLTLQAVRFGEIDGASYGINLNNPDNRYIYDTWIAAYRTISMLNQCIEGLEHARADFAIIPYLSELHVIRAYTYYQMGVLWGNVPLLTHSDYQFEQLSQQELFNFCQQEIEYAISLRRTRSYSRDEKYVFNTMSALTLLGEIELWYDAWNSPHYKKGEFDNQLYITVDTPNLQGKTEIAVYDTDIVNLLKDEKDGKDPEQLVTKWKEKAKDVIGAWAAVKRLGKAQLMTGCEEYELLLPIPTEEIIREPNIVQNPGY